MQWENATEYRALIGNCLYVDAPSIVKVNGQSIITLTRNTENGSLAASFDIFDEFYNKLAEVKNNEIKSLVEVCQAHVNGSRRCCLIDMRSGFVLCDIKTDNQRELDIAEIEISFVTHSPLGTSIVFHSDRTRIGPPVEKATEFHGITFSPPGVAINTVSAIISVPGNVVINVGEDASPKENDIPRFLLQADATCYFFGCHFIKCASVNLYETI